MEWNWHIYDNHLLVLINDNETIYPTAQEVFLSEFKSVNQVRNNEVQKPSSIIHTIGFSKFPLEIMILIELTHNEKININVNVVTNRDGKLTKVGNIIEENMDHVIIESTWYPFVNGSVEEIHHILRQAGINKLGTISLQQYLSLKKMGIPKLIDEFQNYSFDKGDYISKNNINVPRFVGELYPYQNQGFRWLRMIVGENAGCILADEMGLGKTAQVIALIALESLKAEAPSLVVAPVSLLENWKREVFKFSPELNVLIHQGNNRTGFYSEFTKYDLIVTSYETVSRDLSLFQMLKWNIIIADEAQNIKNPLAKRTKAIKALERASTIAVTGTPVENRLIDLWSLTDFVFPSYLGNLKEFQKEFPDSLEGAEKLEPIVSPIILRRRVKEVAKDLPERINVPQVLRLSKKEAELYDLLRTQIIEEYGKHASLVSLIKLRMFCTHPFLINSSNDDPALFGKYMRLVEILDEIISNKEKVIIFTSYTEMTDILVKDLTSRFNIYCDFIDGRVEVIERQQIIDKFSDTENAAILVLNPRAAGAGLNITAANHVIHYNLEWNPAIEDQASARAYRRGQKRPVTIHRLFYLSTVEEAINERLERKRNMSEAAVIGVDGKENDQVDILNALQKSPLF